ncbi:MAG: hypothetical protein JW881_21790 [Spirochaetales bacterium]|nr:hypothetical protein [Spirochaetales bacterium]
MKEEIEKIINSSTVNGNKFWARTDGDIHAPAGYSTIDILNTLGDLGIKYDQYPVIADTIDFVFTYYDESGCFRYSPKSSKLPCITARLLTAFGRLGYSDDRLEVCYQKLLNTQEEDGGWRCNTVKLGKSPSTDASNPGTTLYVLDAFHHRNNSEKDILKLEKGVIFLLSHWQSKLPLGPCSFGIGTNFQKIEYPLIRYNLLYYCHVLSRFKVSLDSDYFQEAISLITDKAEDGKIKPENPHRLWREFSFAQKDKESQMATKKYQEILNNLA